MELSHYVRHLRVDMAREFLKNPKKTIDDIAEDCGFTDRIHFSKVFKRLTGETPGQYRRLLNTTAKKTVPRDQSPGEEPALSACIAYTRSQPPNGRSDSGSRYLPKCERRELPRAFPFDHWKRPLTPLITNFYSMRLRRAKNATIKPVPSRAKVVGSGTTEKVRLVPFKANVPLRPLVRLV